MSHPQQPSGIPTLYRGVQYRSRLEAKWAAFFDLLGWGFQYEPFDLDGWIPDFLLTEARVLVEIKPITDLPTDVVIKIERALPDEFEAMVGGCSLPSFGWNFGIHPTSGKVTYAPFTVETSDGHPIGWMLARPPDWQPLQFPTWGLALVQRFTTTNHLGTVCYDDLGLFHSHDHMMRCDPGQVVRADDLKDFAFNRFFLPSDSTYWGVGTWEKSAVMSRWNRAGNLVQWRGRKSEVKS